MRLPLPALEVFTAIAQHGSLKAAAQALGLKPSTVSHQLKTLEAHLDTALFIRTTRSVNLTEAGRALFRGAGPAFEQLCEAVETARSTGHSTRGELRLAMPEFVYQLYVSPVLESFRTAYPDIEIELQLTDALTDILEDGLHAGFRLGDHIAEDMVAVRLTEPLPLAVLGSPRYFAAHGVPVDPHDLLRHDCIRYRFQSSGRLAPWSFLDGEDQLRVDVKGSIVTNTLPTLVDSARRGLGLCYTFRDYCAQDIANGYLETALEAHVPNVPGVFMYFPREYRSSLPVRCFLDHVTSEHANS